MKPEKPLKAITSKMVIVFLLILFPGCEEFPYHSPDAIFVSHYINYAWGYQDRGFVIDSEGNVSAFNMPASWNYPDGDGYISAAEMEQNLAQLEEPYCKVSKYDLVYYATKLDKARKGKITEPEHRMCDAGSTAVAGYIYESGTDRYRYVFIRQTGDFYSENTSREADLIYEWMQDPCMGDLTVRLR